MNPTWNAQTAVEHARTNARVKSTGACARYTRQAIEAGGLTLARTTHAKDYGPSLVNAGFQVISPTPTVFEVGDVVVISGFEGTESGHMAIYDGQRWISDFIQTALYPGPGYRKAKPAYKIYRFPKSQ